MKLIIVPTLVRRSIGFARIHGKKLALSLSALLVVTVLISCVHTSHIYVSPPFIPGAEYVGSETCAECHEEITIPFRTATHANLMARGGNAIEAGCESCHGAGSIHVEAGGGRDNIINPDRSPQVCFSCHLNTRGEFNLPFHHPVAEGKIRCSDCHEMHHGPAVRRGGSSLALERETCGRCHPNQHGPFVFEHEAMREGCTICHSPHGSVNNKMLVQRNHTLCLKCHFQHQPAPGRVVIGGFDHTGLLSRGTCWSAGCHEAVHGSQINSSLRY
jgi:predicted CXXCH cytochrome family protein